MKPTRLLSGLVVLAACGGKSPAPAPPAPTQVRHYAFRAIGGVSMGGMGSSFIGTSNPSLFDGIGSLGGPMDFSYLLHFIQTSDTGGFCTLSQLQALLEQDPTGAILNDPSALGCMQQATPQVLPYEHTATFDHWRYTDNGGNFDREAYIELFEDLSEAFGNPGIYNPQSSFFPPGLTQTLWAQPAATFCSSPMVIKGKLSGGTQPLYNAEYNPNGDYDVISFCDGQRPIYYCANTPDEEVDWCQMTPGDSKFPGDYCQAQGAGAVEQASTNQDLTLYLQEVGTVNPCWPASRPMYVALAVDLNGNGKRDYGEPIVVNAHERFQDVGTDGCPDPMEDGKGGCVTDAPQSPYDAATDPDPNGDDYDFRQNPFGTENDWRWEQGEPFDDYGLDGVPNTGDYGESNGVFDQSPAMANYFAVDPRTNIVKSWLTPNADGVHVSQLLRVDYLIDGGVRDVFNFGVSGAQIFGLLSGLLPTQTQLFADFTSWPSANAPFANDNDFQADQANWGLIPRDLMTFYGTLEATPEQILAGDGDHVGTVGQALDRFDALYHWFSHRWDAFADVQLGSNPEDFPTRSNYTQFYSQSLGANRDFAIVVPPGYDSPENASARYPVIYILHGYGMSALDMMSTDIVFDGDMQTGDLRKMIAVFPSGQCCFTNTQTGEHDCTETYANGVPGAPAGTPNPWGRECNSGTFFVNSQGGPLGPPRAYLDSFIDLVSYVDQNYRTLAATGGQDVSLPSAEQ